MLFQAGSIAELDQPILIKKMVQILTGPLQFQAGSN